MIIVSWNYRELDHPSKLNLIKDLIKKEKSNILLIQETNISNQEMDSITTKIKKTMKENLFEQMQHPKGYAPFGKNENGKCRTQ